MKRIIIIVSLLMLSNVVWAQKAPDGFLGIKWGTTEEEYEKMVKPTFDKCDSYDRPIRDDHTNFYACGQWKKIGDAPVTRYFFSFSKKDGFYSVSVEFPKDSSFDVFLKALTEKYGKPSSTEPLFLQINPNAKVGMVYHWTLENKVSIFLRYNDMEKAGINGDLIYIYLPIWNQVYKPKDIKKTKDKL